VAIYLNAFNDMNEANWANLKTILETKHDAVMERVDAKGRVIGFSIMGVSKFKKSKPLEADLVAA
jgi:hypothetical protein